MRHHTCPVTKSLAPVQEAMGPIVMDFRCVPSSFTGGALAGEKSNDEKNALRTWSDFCVVLFLGRFISQRKLENSLLANTARLTRKLSEPYAESHPSIPPIFSQMKFPESDLSLNKAHWIAEAFNRRECARFIPTNKYPEKCGCGRLRHAHIDIPSLTSSFLNHHGGDIVSRRREPPGSDAADEHIEVIPPRCRGRKSGGPHPHKAQYVRLAFDTDPALIISMFEEVWQIAPPKLIITVHGGTNNFDIQPKLARVFRRGLLRAATTTGAWIITSGVDTGVVRHVAAAFEGASSSSRNKVVCIGISPWGLLRREMS
ncbi:hypothetical protein KIN20_030867 [Parelaphostrongylus tenuis]|uniref:TRPM SLOG domain-containing protein n=1 Tax=Parelaphostrongylus tenuis TaxID=148309 RepID=A0AAD5R4D4_PARTN|nr:hypothetical protein KIN20_030867 [Parelaphostrongylus tenuis]